MEWMERNFDLRIDPTRLVDGSKTVISVAMSYNYSSDHRSTQHTSTVFSTGNPSDSVTAKIAKYAQGRDYHKVLKKALKSLYTFIQEEIGGEIHGRFFVDSAPVMERAWAVRSGLGWLGKNGNLLRRDAGSWILLGEIILDVDFVYDAPVSSHCGSCTRCIDACPTQAITGPGIVDSTKCISYLTIEFKESIPHEFKTKLEGWAFGCDICQDVCPWNRKALPADNPDLRPRDRVTSLTKKDWMHMDELLYEEVFSGSAVKRAGFERLKKNALLAMGIRKTDD